MFGTVEALAERLSDVAMFQLGTGPDRAVTPVYRWVRVQVLGASFADCLVRHEGVSGRMSGLPPS